MTALRPLIILTVVASLAGCRRGPDTEELRAELQQSLDQDFVEGLFEVADLSRKGVFPYKVEGDERDRLLVYYDAEIEFQRDHRLTDWESIGVGSLLGVLGATPRGVAGVEPDGNTAGDRLVVYGAAPYARQDDAWQVAADRGEAGLQAGEVTQPGDIHEALDHTPRQRRLMRLEQVGAGLDRAGDDHAIRRFDADLERFVALEECRSAAADGRPALATGQAFGEYAVLGTALGGVLTDADAEPCLLSTAGSVENCERLAAGDVNFALAQGDVAAMAYAGTGIFDGHVPAQDLRVLSALYPEAIQIATLEGTGVRELADLTGRRVSLGEAGSGTRANAMRVLRAAGISPGQLETADSRPTAEALDALAAGDVDAVFVTSAWPLGALTDLAARAELRLVPIPAETIERLAAIDRALVEVTLPANTYPGEREPCPTVAVTSLLLSRADVDDDLVTILLDATFDHVQRLGEHSSHAWHVSPATAKTGASIPLHSAADRYLAGR
jgi:TRAP transporter TAXI family solute receptor